MKRFALAVLCALGAVAARGQVDITVTTASYGGEYAPANCLALYVETGTGSFVKTLAVWAYTYREYLTRWYTTADNTGLSAITGASQTGHGTRTCSWDLTDAAGSPVAAGEYKIVVEMTEDNGTGRLKKLTFPYDGTGAAVSAPDDAVFTGFRAVYGDTAGGTEPAPPDNAVIPNLAPPPPTAAAPAEPGVCGAGSIMAMGITFMALGAAGRTRGRKNRKGETE